VTPVTWPCPVAGGGFAEEMALTFDRDRAHRLLIVPALFEEAGKLRRLTVEVMRRLDGAGIDSFVPDLPGCGESLQPLETVTFADWQDAVAAAAAHFRASHVLGVRGGALLTPPGMQGWHYAPAKGASTLRQMIRARIFASREAGVSETYEALLREGEQSGLELAGYRLSPPLVDALQYAVAPTAKVIEQDTIGGGGLWLRAEPDEDRQQADALAALLAIGIKV
jgi:pimeloyl-ACP methyl ester carboxylesterase